MSCVSDEIDENEITDVQIRQNEPPKKSLPTLLHEKLPEKKKTNGGAGSDSTKGIQKSASIPVSSSLACRTKYQGINLVVRSKSFTKRTPSKQFYVTLTPPEKKKPPPPPVSKKPSYVGERLATSNGVAKEFPKVYGGVKENIEANGSVKDVSETIESIKDLTETPLTLPAKVASKEVTDINTEQNGCVETGTEPKRGKKFLVAKEMMTSEKVFVDVLRLLNEDFRGAVKDSDIPENSLNLILNCLPQLLQLNEELLKEMENRIEKWDEIGRISDVIVHIGPFLKLYTSYIKNFSSLTESLKDACKKYPQFSEAVKQFERSSRCQKLCVSHYMLKPVQRIPQYKLLLQDYLKCLNESSLDYQATQDALTIVSEVAEHANETIKQTEHFEKLMEIQTRITGGFQVIAPGRSFLRDGELLKLCRKGMQTRKFYLFSDCLLHCSMASMGLFKVHHALKLASMKVIIPMQEDYRNEFSIISEARSFTLSACSAEERDDWVDSLNRAIDNMSARMETFLQGKIQKCGLKESLGEDSLGNKAPVWIPDARVTLCPLCTREFSLTFRRHHCRACGKVVCALCSANQAPVRYQKYEPVRVCDLCYKILFEDIEKMAAQPKNVVQASEEVVNLPALWQLKGLFKKFNVSSPNFKKPDLSPVLTEVRASIVNCSMKGYLHSRVKKTWKKQWFVIKDKVLYAFKASEDAAALSSTPLLGFDVITYSEDQEGIPANMCFRLNHLNHPPMLFYADNCKVAERWIEAMKKATVL